YLAVHYNGQAWGMIASFSYLNGAPLSERERHAIRGTLYVFMLWHVAIAYSVAPEYATFFPWVAVLAKWLLPPTTLLAHIGRAGAVGGSCSRRAGARRGPPLAMLVPVPVLYLGYLIMTGAREAILLLQFAHALQYLIFPLRVEMNRAEVSSPQRRRGHLLAYLL